MTHAPKQLLIGCLLVGVVTGGCTKRRDAVIVRHPEWEYQEYQRLAVVPVSASNRQGADAARQAEYCLVDELTASNAFEVLSRSDLAAVLSEQDLANLADVADPSTAIPAGKVKVAQAMVIGRLTDVQLTRNQQQVRVPRYGLDRQGRRVRLGDELVTEYRHAARLGGNVRVVDTATNRVLFSHTLPPIEKDEARRGSPPSTTPEELAVELAREIATDFCRRIAPQSVRIKLGGDCLLVATKYYEGQYVAEKKISVSEPEILLVARDMPKACERNDFRLAVSPIESGEYLVDHAFTWSPSVGQRGEVVRVPVEVLRESGARKFTAKLFAAGNEQPILARDFELVDAKAD